MCLSDSEVGSLRKEALSTLMTSELVSSDTPSTIHGPGCSQYLLSLAQVALSASVEIPELWGGVELTGQLLQYLLQSKQYEVRELALEGVFRRLQQDDGQQRRPQWLDEATLSNLTCLALHETHPQCLAKVRPHTQSIKEVCLVIVCVCLRACRCVWLF